MLDPSTRVALPATPPVRGAAHAWFEHLLFSGSASCVGAQHVAYRMISSVIDTVLDRTVVAGFTNVGYRIRSRGWTASELRRMQGEVVLVTGASSGLGLAAAEGFARLGASVWLVVRSRERGEDARVRIVERSG